MFGSNDENAQLQSGGSHYVNDPQLAQALGFGGPGSPPAQQTRMGNMDYAAQTYGDIGGLGDMYGGGGGGRGARQASVAAGPVQQVTYATPAAMNTYQSGVQKVAQGYRPANVTTVRTPTSTPGYVPPYTAIAPAFWWTTDPATAQAAAAGDPEAQAKMAAQAQGGGGITWTKILGGLVLVAAAAGGYYYWTKRKGKKSGSKSAKSRYASEPEDDSGEE